MHNKVNKMQIIKSVESVKVGQTIGLSFTNNNRQYKIIGRVDKINGNTIKIVSCMHVGGYESGRIFTYSFRKSTKQNHVFMIPLAMNEAHELTKQVIEFNDEQQRVNAEIEKMVDEYWKKRFEKADKERKEQGVYEESTVYEIDFNKGELVPQYKKYRISE